MKFAHILSIVCVLVKKKSKILYDTCPVTFSFQDIQHRQMVQAIRPRSPRSYNGSKRPPSISRQTAVRRTKFSPTRLNM
jgi:hypothetical protein